MRRISLRLASGQVVSYRSGGYRRNHSDKGSRFFDLDYDPSKFLLHVFLHSALHGLHQHEPATQTAFLPHWCT